MGSLPGADAVVLNWKDNTRTINCVRHLREIPEIRRIIVVDNESDGSLGKELHESRVEQVIYLEQAENLGFSAGVNIGLRKYLEGTARYALVINNDATPDGGSIMPLIAECRNQDDWSITAPLIRNVDGSVQSRGERFQSWHFGILPAGAEDPDFLTWACVLVPRAVLNEVGLLDEGFFMYWEDVEYGFRAKSHGVSLQCVDTVSVTHERSVSHTRASTKVDLFSALGVVRLSRKGPWTWRVGAAVRIILRIAMRLVHREPRAARAILIGARLGLRTKITGAAAVKPYM